MTNIRQMLEFLQGVAFECSASVSTVDTACAVLRDNRVRVSLLVTSQILLAASVVLAGACSLGGSGYGTVGGDLSSG